MKKFIFFILALFLANTAMSQVRVSGTVTSSDDGSTIPYAYIMIKGSTNMNVSTDLDGRYEIDVPADAVLIFSFLGYTTQEIPVNGRSVINVSMLPDAMRLDEVIMVAYGAIRKGSYSGSASVVRNDVIKDAPMLSVEQAIAGSVPGMLITSDSGLPGSMPEMRIRGIGSFNAGNSPLYVIDGIPVTSGSWSNNNSTTSSMNFLDPSNIASITVLKDAAAASLYGSRAANGVVLVTTKTGSQGKAISTFKASMGFSTFAVDNYPLCTDEEKEMLVREALTNYATDNSSVWDNTTYGSIENYVNNRSEYYYPARKAGYEYTNWEDLLFRTATAQNYEVSISGGNEDSKVFASAAYTNTQGLSTITQMNRFSTIINASHRLSKSFTIGGSSQFSSTDQDGFQDSRGQRDSPWYAAVVKLTERFPFKNPDGTYYLDSYDGTAFRNPYPGLDKQIANSKQARLLLRGWAELSILNDLKLKTVLNYDNLRVDDRFAWLMGHQYGEVYGKGYVGDRYNRINRLVSSTTLNYSRTFNERHNLSAMAGWEAESMKSQYTDLSKADFANYNLTSTVLAATVRMAETRNDKTSMLSLIGSLNYDYDNRYYLTATFRRDGSSQLSPSKRWGNLWSLSGSWRIINESFMKNAAWLNDLKVRGSYGISATLPNGYYDWQTTYSYGKYGGDNSSFPSSYADRNLTWESNYIWNVALEGRFLNRFSFVAEYYNRTTKDLLLNASIPSITGFENTLRNVGSMLNRGVELSLNIDILNRRNFRWDLGFNWSSLHNEILALSVKGEPIYSSPYIRTEGYSFYQYYTREYLGADPQTGAPMYYTNKVLEDGKLEKVITNTTSNASNAIIEGKTGLPKGFGGLNTNVSYRNFSLSLVFNYQYGHYVWDDATDYIQTDGRNLFDNMSKKELNRWQKPGDITDVPRLSLTSQGGYYNSTRWLYRGDYIRLKNVTLSYNIPQNITTKASLKSARLYASGSNLLTITGLDFDPEVPTGGKSGFRVPPMKTITFGIEISF